MQNFIVIVFVGNVKSELIIMFYLHYEKYSIKGNEKTNNNHFVLFYFSVYQV